MRQRREHGVYKGAKSNHLSPQIEPHKIILLEPDAKAQPVQPQTERRRRDPICRAASAPDRGFHPAAQRVIRLSGLRHGTEPITCVPVCDRVVTAPGEHNKATNISVAVRASAAATLPHRGVGHLLSLRPEVGSKRGERLSTSLPAPCRCAPRGPHAGARISATSFGFWPRSIFFPAATHRRPRSAMTIFGAALYVSTGRLPAVAVRRFCPRHSPGGADVDKKTGLP